MTTARRSPSVWLPWAIFPAIIILLGILLTLWIQLFVQNGVVFGGEGGLRALVTQQLAQQIKAGQFPLDIALNPTTIGWVSDVWQQGLFPFSPPFVQTVEGQSFTTLPFAFPVLSAPFYALFGDRGLYIIPLVALWSIWFRFWQVGLRVGLRVGSLCLGLVSLVFASPLSLYGGIHWEHTLAIALAFWGISALLFPVGSSHSPSGRSPLSHSSSGRSPLSHSPLSRSPKQLLNSGLLIGLSAWFRPECLYLAAIVSLLIIIGCCIPKWKLAPQFTAFQAFISIGAIFCAVGFFFAINYAIYGNLLGVYALQLGTATALSEPVAQATASYSPVLQSLSRYLPVLWVVGIAALLSPELRPAKVKPPSKFAKAATAKSDYVKGHYFQQIGLRTAAAIDPIPSRFILTLSLLFLLGIPLLMPTDPAEAQWGPQRYLILVPLASLILTQQLSPAFFRNWARKLILIGTAIALVFGIHINTINGAFASFQDGQNTSIRANYTQARQLINVLRQPTVQPWIAVSHQSVAHQFWSALPQKTFFYAQTVDETKQLATALVAQNESEFLYICQPDEACPVPEAPTNELALADGIHSLDITLLDTYGIYPMYKVEIVP
ncbi:MAG: hypothetical protein AAFR58_12355 [Cyanobacteria bacterium J06627_28]